jgi:hypothetical protein
LAKPSRIPRARKSSDNASSIAAPVLSMLLIVLPSTMSHLMPGWAAATSSTRFLKYGALKNTSVAPKRWSTGISFLDDEVKIDFLRRTVQLEGANKRRVTKKGGSNGHDT